MRHFFALAALLTVVASAAAQDGDQFADELRLKAAGFPIDGPGLVAFFKARTTTAADPARLAKLVEALADKDEDARMKAYRELLGLGPIAVPALRVAANDPDVSTANALARQALDNIQAETGNAMLMLAARVLARKSEPGAVAALLGFLPYTDSEEVVDELKRSLNEVAFDAAGKPSEVLLKALSDEEPARRAAAAEVLGQRGAEPRAALLKMLADPKGSVRLKAALALAQAKEPKALETMIAVLSELPPHLGRDAEDYLITLAAEQSPKVPLGTELATREKARAAWEDWWKKSDSAALLDEFKKRTMSDERREAAQQLIKKFNDDDFKVRQGAEDELVRLGVVVVPLLRKMLAGEATPEAKERARRAIAAIEKVAPGSLSPVFPRLVAFRKPAGAVEVLLDFLPFADEDVVLSEVQTALNVLAGQGGKALPPLLAALTDKQAVRRAAAAEALCAAGTKEMEEVRKLLKDADAVVKLKTVLALVNARDRDAVTLLIEAVTDAPVELLPLAEDLLAKLAGEDALAGQPGTDAAARQQRREKWALWWKDKGSKVPLATLLARTGPERYLGHTLIISPNHSKIMEVGSDGKTRWEIGGLSNVWDAQFVGRSRILILEPGSQRVTERTLRGDILWEMSYRQFNVYPLALQRLQNNNILLIASNRIVEVTRGGKEVFSHVRNNGDILHARKLRDGTIVYITSSSTVHRLDGAGKEIKTWRVNNPSNQGCDILPNGNVIYPQQWANRVYEYDANGQQVWTAVASQPSSVVRLPNGNTLVGSNSPYQVVELDRTGKQVWKVTLPIQPLRILRR